MQIELLFFFIVAVRDSCRKHCPGYIEGGTRQEAHYILRYKVKTCLEKEAPIVRWDLALKQTKSKSQNVLEQKEKDENEADSVYSVCVCV